MYWSYVWIMLIVWCLVLYISVLVKVEWLLDLFKKGLLRLLKKDIVILILIFFLLF